MVYFVAIQLLLVVVFVAKYSKFTNFILYEESVEPCKPEISLNIDSMEKEDRPTFTVKNRLKLVLLSYKQS